MGAVSEDRMMPIVMGSLRGFIGQVDAAATGDTFETGIGTLLGAFATSSTGVDIGVTISGSEVTLVYSGGGAQANIQLIVLGQ